MDIPLIAKKMLEKYRVSRISDKEHKAWENRFLSCLNEGGRSSLDSETSPLRNDIMEWEKQIKTLAAEAKKTLYNTFAITDPDLADLCKVPLSMRDVMHSDMDTDCKNRFFDFRMLCHQIENGTLTGEKYSYNWQGQEIMAVNNLTDDDQKLFTNLKLNSLERDMAMATSAQIASLNAKIARTKDVLRIAEHLKENFIPGDLKSNKENKLLAKETAQQFKINSKNKKSPYGIEDIAFVMQFALDHPEETNVSELVRNIRKHADCPTILQEKGLKNTTKPERNWIKKIDKAAGIKRY